MHVLACCSIPRVLMRLLCLPSWVTDTRHEIQAWKGHTFSCLLTVIVWGQSLQWSLVLHLGVQSSSHMEGSGPSSAPVDETLARWFTSQLQMVMVIPALTYGTTVRIQWLNTCHPPTKVLGLREVLDNVRVLWFFFRKAVKNSKVNPQA